MMVTRNVSLTPSLDAFVSTCLRSGRFGTASEVVRAGLRLLRQSEERQTRARERVGTLRSKPVT